MSLMRISQLAERTGVPATTLRFYEGAGLLPAGRTASGYRTYGEDAVERLAFIRAAKQLGLTLDEITGLLTVWEGGSCAEVKADLRLRITGRLAEAERRATALGTFTTALHIALERLDALPDRTERCTPECGLPSSTGPGTRREKGWRDTAPVACSLTGAGQVERTARWHELLDGAERTPFPGGLRLTLPAERAGEIAVLAVAEQECCPFFDFDIRLDHPVIHLQVGTGADGAGLLTDLFGTAPGLHPG
ncbi:MerR family transcriptional regulator [Kitasatospora sp. RB6PN24]|uniref:MerR family transcriptional regulator n=1 Tax=Kitasatospora humi TaxID=2893891 RepID=UPI001E4C5E5A|nr:MerR family transcriptional regulator [Kitasatospora humi]MCC9311583.1 MerR family transcriptional regulator [Kitasatospora humi]